MRPIHFSALLAAFLVPAGHVASQVSAGEIRVISPGVVHGTAMINVDGGVEPSP